MKIKFWVIVIGSFLVSLGTGSFAETKSKVNPNKINKKSAHKEEQEETHPPILASKEGEFSMEPGLVDKIYSTSIEKEHSQSSAFSHALEVTPSVALVFPDQLVLKNEYFRVDYTEDFNGAALFGIDLKNVNDFSPSFPFSYGAFLAYGFKQGPMIAESTTGTEIEDNIHLQWGTFLFEVESGYRLLSISFVRPEVILGAGASWFSQSGEMDGISQSFWLPQSSVGGGLRLFEGYSESYKDKNLFSGIKLHALRHQTYNNKQKYDGWMYVAGVGLVL